MEKTIYWLLAWIFLCDLLHQGTSLAECDFQGGFCGYTQATDDDFNWSRKSGPTPSSNTGPREDHTRKDASGIYAFIEATSQSNGDKARLESEVFSDAGVYCVEFWYHMYGSDVGTLNMYMKPVSFRSLGNAEWTKSGDQEDRWWYGLVSLRMDEPFQVIYEAVRGASFQSDIALDDVSVTAGECQPRGLDDCNFELPTLCGYTQDDTDDFDWAPNQGSTVTPGTGPSVDATYGSAKGTYMFLNVTSAQGPFNRARLVSPVVDPAEWAQDLCWTFSYHMYGSDIGTMNIKVRDNGTTVDNTVWVRGTNLGNDWYKGQVHINKATAYHLVIEGVTTGWPRAHMAIDDVGFIMNSTCSDTEGSCDFEDGTCVWSNSFSDDMDWLEGSGATVSFNTGPATDHTLGTAEGTYLFIETSLGDYDHKAVLLSPPLETRLLCLSFWYIMYGPDIGSLKIMVTTGLRKTVMDARLIWGQFGQKSFTEDMWLEGRILVNATIPYRIEVVGSRGNGYSGDIAIDDFDISRETDNCPVSPVGADPASFQTFDCDFEYGTCGWVQLETDDIDWIVDRRTTLTESTGPSDDHSPFGGGYYIYMEGNNPPGFIADLTSPVVEVGDGDGLYCMKFWYHMYGSSMGFLNISLGVYEGGEVTSYSKRWLQTGDRGNDWMEGTIQINAEKDFQILIQGEVGPNIFSDIALDDITLQEGACPDEAFCHFELDLCGWSQVTGDDDFDWSRGPATDVSYSGQVTDKTTGTKNGYLIYLDTAKQNNGDQAWLYSYNITAIQQDYCLQFWYRYSGSGVIQVGWRHPGESDVFILWTEPATIPDQWLYGSVTIAPPDIAQIIIKGIVGSYSDAFIGLDEISLTFGACAQPASCSFEDGYCGWRQERESDRWDWERNAGGTNTGSTGPTFDHTRGDFLGFYIFFESSGPEERDTARLISEPLLATTGRCFEFWYHMYGATIGTLNLYLKGSKVGSQQLLFQKSGAQGPGWIRQRADIYSSVDFFLVFEAVQNVNGPYGDIALDDFRYLPYLCDSQPPTSAPTQRPTSPPTAFNCDFENGNTCTWTQVGGTSDDFDWDLSTGATDTLGTGPPADHTQQNQNGYYLHINVSAKEADSVARIISAPFSISNNDSAMCLEFWYHMYGSHVDTLNVLLVTETDNFDKPTIWTRSGNQGYDWLYDQVEVADDLRDPLYFVFEGYAGDGYRGDIALDDLKVINGSCPGRPLCDFEDDGICGYTLITGDPLYPYSWTATTPSDTPELGIPRDHSLSTNAGHFLYVTGDSTTNITGRAVMYSHRYPVDPSSFYTRVTYWSVETELLGDITLEAFVTDGAFTSAQIRSQGSVRQSDFTAQDGEVVDREFWRHNEYYLFPETGNGGFITIVFTADIQKPYIDGVLAVDDVSLVQDNGPIQFFGCSFETDLCSWSNTQHGDEFDWLRHSGSTGSTQTGPPVDHTLGTPSGWYLYIEASDSNEGHRARLESTVVKKEDALTEKCFQFWYHMSGSSVGTLRVFWETSRQSLTIWSLSGDQGDQWVYGEASYYPPDDFRLIIEAIRGSDHSSDISIDDVAYQATCTQPPQSTPFTCGDGSSVPQKQVCDWFLDCTDGSDEENCLAADFDSGLGGYYSQEYYLFPWANVTSPQPSGPPGDATKNPDGGYMAVDIYNKNPGGESKAVLESATIQQVYGRCQLSVWYYLGGQRPGTLFISYAPVNSFTEKTVLTRIGQGNHANFWQDVIIDLNRIARPFKLYIEAQPLLSFGEFIAIDYITLSAGGCAPLPRQPSCSDGEFRCSNGACVSDDLKCDFTDDCGDFSDEFQCEDESLRCSFESGLCLFSQDTRQDNVDWELMSSALYEGSSNTVPTRDRTRNEAAGTFLLLEQSRQDVYAGRKAWLLSPAVYAKDGDNCKVKFWYYLWGVNVGSIMVYVRHDASPPTSRLFDAGGHREFGAWMYQELDLVWDGIGQLVFQATSGSGNVGSIALDDIVFTPGCTYTDDLLPGFTTLAPTSPRPTTPRVCNPSWFICGAENDVCVTPEQMCDFFPNCPTGLEDEAMCGDCEFDDGLCGMIYVQGWISVQAGFYPNYPTEDSGQSPTGYYAATFSSYNSMKTPLLGPSGSQCQMEFYYYMSGDKGALNVVLQGLNVPTQAFGVDGEDAVLDSWQKLNMFIGAVPGRFQLEFRSQRFSDSPFRVSVDGITYIDCDPQSSLPSSDSNCTFEDGLCGYYQLQAPDDDFDWTRTNGPTGSFYTGPTFDHTTGQGYYVFIETSGGAQGAKARLALHPQKPTGAGGVCLTFWYHMYGDSMGSLNVYLKVGTAETLLFTKHQTQGNDWRKGQLPLKSDQGWQLVFEGVRGWSFTGDIALDDIIIYPGTCQVSRECSFENGFCLWTQSASDDFDWSIGSNGTISDGTGPPTDNTRETDNGQYAYVYTESGRFPGETSHLLSPTYPDTTAECLSFYYIVSGDDVGVLSVWSYDLIVDEFYGPLLEIRGSDETVWRKALITVSASHPYRIVIQAFLGIDLATGTIAIDDVDIQDGPCPRQGFCDFEDGLCTWLNEDSEDDFDWILDSAGTSTWGTGPSVDHTLGTDLGHYLFLEASFGTEAGYKTWLVSQYVLPSEEGFNCLYFWYHMYGSGIGDLRVYMRPEGQNMTEVWFDSGNNGDIWLQGQVNLYSDIQYQLVIEGVRGATSSSDIALDDIDIDHQICQGQAGGSSNLDCTFEDGLCSYRLDPTSDVNWEIGINDDFGPEHDHTSGSGSYLYLNTTITRINGDQAILTSPLQTPTPGGRCLTFWYHMLGIKIDRLDVYVQEGQNRRLVFRRLGDQGDEWLRAEKTIKTDLPWTLSFEGRYKGKDYGDISVDDVVVLGSECQASRECDFEGGFCGWAQEVQNDQLDWSLNQGPTTSQNTGPSVDHSTMTKEGYYAYLESSYGQPGDTAQLWSPVYPHTAADCFTMWYHMYGDTIGTLNMYMYDLVTEELGAPIFTRTGINLDEWRFTQLTLRAPHRFQVVLEAIKGDSYSGDIAVDDIALKYGACSGKPGFCDFEDGTCSWRNEQGQDNVDWVRMRGEHAHDNDILFDHTTGTDMGFYLSFEMLPPVVPQSHRAILLSEHMPASPESCFLFWYHMSAKDLGRLRAYKMDGSGSAAVIFEATNAWINTWNLARVPVVSAVDYQIYLEGLSLTNTEVGHIAIDDIDLEPFSCTLLSTPAPPFTPSVPGTTRGPGQFDCTFEDDLCLWGQEGTDDFNWDRQQGLSPSGTAGPSYDHTTGSVSGFYIFANATSRSANDAARIIGPDVTSGAEGYCLQFWYYMYGSSVGTLNAYIRYGGSDTLEWTRAGNQGNQWMRGQMFLKEGKIKVLFEAVANANSDGIIALDDVFFFEGSCPVADLCDFESTMVVCGFYQYDSDVYNWMTASGSGKDSDLRPPVDVTYGTSFGHYLFFNDSSDDRSSTAVFYTQPVTSIDTCVRFNYRTNGPTATLTIKQEVNGNALPGQSFSTGQKASTRWHVGQATFTGLFGYKLQFEATLEKGDTYVAIDDIEISGKSCEQPANCNFEGNLCTYVNLDGDQFDWFRQPGSSQSEYVGPTIDHTFGLSSGHYTFADTSSPRSSGDMAWLVTDTLLEVSVPYCVSMWYYRDEGDDTSAGTLRLYQRKSESARDHWSQLGSWSDRARRNNWFHQLVDVSALWSLAQLVFEVEAGDGAKGGIAIDDLQLYPGECVSPTVPPCVFQCQDGSCLHDPRLVCDFRQDCPDGDDEESCGDCDFEDGFCGYRDISTGSYRWRNSTGASASTDGGPYVDKTLGTPDGTYLLVTADFGSGYSLAILESSDLYNSAPGCLLNFWTHIQGEDFDHIGAFLTVGTSRTLLHWVEEDLGPFWTKQQVPVGRIVGPFRIEIEAQRSLTDDGHMALDDISFTGCGYPDPSAPCQADEFTCDNKRCILQTRVCDLTDDCGDLSDETACDSYTSCTFEEGTCAWTQIHTDELDWDFRQGLTRTPWTGPAHDHTIGTEQGTYLYLESSPPRQEGDRARLGSPVFGKTSQDCQLRFYFSLYGKNIGTLSVYTRGEVNGPLTLRWYRKGELGDYYERADVQLDNADPFQVIIEATVGDGKEGDIAIDDTSFTPECTLHTGDLPVVATVAPTAGQQTDRPCTAKDFFCGDGSCIDLDLRCDGKDDCLDATDELECGECDFEGDLCGWQVIDTGLYKWNRQQANTAPSSKAPSVDHTKATGDGYYMYVDSTQGTFGLSAVLQSPGILGNTGLRCTMVFWYHLYGGEAGTLIVHLYENFIPVETFSVSGDQGDKWNKGSLTIGPRTAAQYQIRFEATPGSGFGNPIGHADIALDDISFEECGNSADINCDFGPNGAKTICGWQQLKDDEFDWKLRKGDTPTYFTGPKFDHTTPEGDGFYLYTEVSSPVSAGNKARISSGQLRSADNYCFTMWYHMYGPTIGELNVYLKMDSDETRIFHKRGTQEFLWKDAHLTVSSQTAFEIIIEGVAGNGFEGDIAIDDLSYSASPCPSTPECEFETDFCGWSNVDDDSPSFDWERGMNGDPLLGTGPATDHSSESTTGYFVFVNVATRSSGAEARLASPSHTLTGVHCLSFFYFMYGGDIGTLYVYKRDAGDQFIPPIWSKAGDQGRFWRQGEVEINPTLGTDLQVYFEAVAGSSSTGSIALDDVALTQGLCPQEDFCDFEKGLCSWQNAFDEDDFDWVRDGAGTGTGGTGPSVDHTTNSKRGYYMYIESSSPRQHGDKAWFVSDRVPPTGGRCFDMWYHMWGLAVGSLNIYKEEVNTIEPELLWTTSGDKGNVWFNTKVNIQSANEFHIVIEGVVGRNFSSDIAIDDLYIDQSPCPVTQPPPTTTTPPPTYAPDTHDCDFEGGNLCLWTQGNSDRLNWIRKKGPTSSTLTGPSADHTTGNGYYIYLESSYGANGYNARLISSLLSSDVHYCMEFYYHMYGENINELNVYKLNDTEALIWRKAGDQGNKWLQGQIQFTYSGAYKIILEAVRGASYRGDIAVDDIRFFTGECPPSSHCDFEFDECGLSAHPLNDFDWQRIQGRDSTTDLKSDHSYGTGVGHYMYASLSGRQIDATGAIVSGFYPPTDGSCLQFFYAHVGNLDAGRLSVRQGSPLGVETELWSVPTGRLHEWHVGEVTLYSNNADEGVSVIFAASRENGTLPGGVAIDDIFISKGSCYPVGACTFEDLNFCSWQNIQATDDFDWAVKTGTTPTFGTGPALDHTLGSAEGHYAFIEASYPQLPNDKAQLLSPLLAGDTTRCFEFYLHMFGDQMGTLDIYRRTEALTMDRLFSFNENKGDVWRKAQVTFDTTERVYDIMIEGIVGSGYRSDIALDDFRLFDGPCPEEGSNCDFYCNVGSHCIDRSLVCDFVPDCPNSHDEDLCGYACTFEDDLCGWTTGDQTAFTWARGRQQTPGDNTGPFIDHTTLSPLGYYAYLTPDLGTQGWGSFISPTLRNSAASCELRFWSSFDGVDIGYLDVLLVTDYTTSVMLRIDESGSASQWDENIVVIGRVTGAFTVEFRGARSFAVQGGIAIDDIKFSGCSLPLNTSATCSPDEFKCDRGACIPDYQLCDFSDDCGDYSDEKNETCLEIVRCDFEADFCNFTNDDNSDVDWSRVRGDDTNGFPNYDHTTLHPSGSFLYVGNAPLDGNRASLAGPVFEPSSGACRMRVWFFHSGDNPGSLGFGARFEQGGSDDIMQELNGPFGEHWIKYEVVYDTTVDFQPLLVAYNKYSSRRGTIALDDISFSEGCILSEDDLPVAPTVIPTTPVGPCGVGSWQCLDGGCINKEQHCDFSRDCSDGSDEISCGPCNFETNFCGYSDVSVGNHKWVLSKVRRSARHSREAGGSFVMVDTATGLFDEPAVLESSILPDSSPKCSVVFWYQFERAQSGQQARLTMGSVDPRNPNSVTELWSPLSETTGTWKKATVGIGRQSGEFKIRFSAYLYQDVDLAAIDDIIWDDCKVEHAVPCDILCGNDLCVAYETECDFTDDCGDMTDESDCGQYKRCDFERGMCDWKQSDTDTLDWMLVSGAQGLGYGAPNDDHTTLTPQGHYLYLRSFAGDENKRARIESAVYLPSDQCKMRFWYFMYGTNVKSLKVLLLYAVNDNPKEIWSMEGNQLDGWVKADIALDQSVKYKVLVEGVAGSTTADDDISIDDFSFTPACSIDPSNTLPETVEPTDSPHCDSGLLPCKSDSVCIAKNQFCDFVFDCADGSDEDDCPTVCNFEDDLCSWEQDKNDDTDWFYYDGSAASARSVPPYDHTVNRPGGKYLYVDSTVLSTNRRARLLSPRYGQSGLTCSLALWYYRYGASFGRLSISISAKDGAETELMTIANDVNNYESWTRQEIKVPVCVKDFMVIISVVGGSANTQIGGYAVDDIRLESCSYDQPCDGGSGLLQCDSGHCYPSDAQCDFSRDCCLSDTDETNCIDYERCDFEDSFCSWHQLPGGEGNWRRLQAGSDVNIPPIDHTSGGSNGMMLLFGGAGTQPGDRAYINSYVISPVAEAQSCAMRFFMFLGDSASEVHVYTRTQNGGALTEVWYSDDIATKQWTRGAVELTSAERFEVVIEAVQGLVSTGVVGLDDFSFTPGCVRSSDGLPGSTLQPPVTTAGTEKSSISPSGTIATKVNTTPVIIIVVVLVVLVILVVCALLFLRCRRTKSHGFDNGDVTGHANPGYKPSETPMTDFKMELDTANLYMGAAEVQQSSMTDNGKGLVNPLYQPGQSAMTEIALDGGEKAS